MKSEKKKFAMSSDSFKVYVKSKKGTGDGDGV